MRFLQTYDILSVSDLKLTEVKDGKEMVKLRGLYKISALALSVMIVAGTGNLAQMTNSDVYAGTASGTATTDRVVSTDGTTWRYLDNNTKPEAGWNSDADFDDSAWSSGKGSFGAKNGQKADLGSGFVPNVLLNQYISGTSNDVPVYYLRTKFDIDDVDVSQIKEITGTVLYDDAAIVTINGKKIAGFDDSSFDENGYGGSNAGEPKTGTVSAVSDGIDISSLNLKAKDNVLAVELHQGRASSSDIYVDLQDLTVSTVLPQKEVRDVSLQIGADETKRNLSWLGESGKASYVQVAVKPSGWKNGDEFPETSARKCRADQVKSGVSGFYSNKAVLKNLDEFTSYIYRVGNDDGWSETYTFATQDLGKKDSFSFLFAGDPQIGASRNTENDTKGWVNTLDFATEKFPQTSFILSAGDQINDKGASEESQYQGFFTPDELQSYALALNEGNHDSGSTLYTAHGNIPNVSFLGRVDSSGKASGDYWYMYNGVLFMNLNSNNRSTSEHRAFMKQALQANPDAQWKIVSFHHSIYSAASHATDDDILERRSELPRIFSDLDIDAVLMGHDHCYTRTYLMDANDPQTSDSTSVMDPKDGQVFYLTANSASGSKYYKYNNDSLTDFIAMKDQSNRPNITNVEVTRTSLTFTTYFTDTKEMPVLDSFKISRTDAEQKPEQVKISKGKIKKAKAGKKKISVSYSKLAKGVKYQISYRKAGSSKWKSIRSTQTYKTIKNLKSGSRYKVRVRGYKTVNGKTYYGKWSESKTVKVR